MRALFKAFVKYHQGLGKMPWYWRPWMLALFTANIIAPLVFITRGEAQVVLAASLVSAALLTVLTASSGFSRLLSLAHVVWFPLIVFVWGRLAANPADMWYGVWLRALVCVNAGSLVIDTINVIRYCGGDRKEIVELQPTPDGGNGGQVRE